MKTTTQTAPVELTETATFTSASVRRSADAATVLGRILKIGRQPRLVLQAERFRALKTFGRRMILHIMAHARAGHVTPKESTHSALAGPGERESGLR